MHNIFNVGQCFVRAFHVTNIGQATAQNLSHDLPFVASDRMTQTKYFSCGKNGLLYFAQDARVAHWLRIFAQGNLMHNIWASLEFLSMRNICAKFSPKCTIYVQDCTSLPSAQYMPINIWAIYGYQSSKVHIPLLHRFFSTLFFGKIAHPVL